MEFMVSNVPEMALDCGNPLKTSSKNSFFDRVSAFESSLYKIKHFCPYKLNIFIFKTGVSDKICEYLYPLIIIFIYSLKTQIRVFVCSIEIVIWDKFRIPCF